MQWFKRLILIIQFMTRIPIPLEVEANQDDFAKGIIFFPIVGLIVGLFAAVVYYVFCFISFGMVCVCMAVLGQTIITGAFHLDGLGDSFDALFANKQKDKMLDILKDSRLGTNGVLAILFSILLKIFLLSSLPDQYIYKSIIVSPVFGRLGIVVCASISNYARSTGGLGRLFTEGVGLKQLIISILITSVISLFFLQSNFILLLVVVLLFSVMTTRSIEKKLGGVTGDIFGMINELIEILMLLLINALI